MDREWLTTGEVAALFGVKSHAVSRWADQGKLACVKTLGGHRRFDAETIRSLVREHESPADPPVRPLGPKALVRTGFSAAQVGQLASRGQTR